MRFWASALGVLPITSALVTGARSQIETTNLDRRNNGSIAHYDAEFMEFHINNMMDEKTWMGWRDFYGNWSTKARQNKTFDAIGEVNYFANEFARPEAIWFECSYVKKGCIGVPTARKIHAMYPNDPELARHIFWTFRYYERIISFRAQQLEEIRNALNEARHMLATIVQDFMQQKEPWKVDLCDSLKKIINSVVRATVTIVSNFNLRSKLAIQFTEDYLRHVTSTYVEFTSAPLIKAYTDSGMCERFDGSFNPDNFERLGAVQGVVDKMFEEVVTTLSQQFLDLNMGSFTANGATGPSDLANFMGPMWTRGTNMDRVLNAPYLEIGKPMRKGMQKTLIGLASKLSGGAVICKPTQGVEAEGKNKTLELLMTRFSPEPGMTCQMIGITNSNDPHIVHWWGYDKLGSGPVWGNISTEDIFNDVWSNYKNPGQGLSRNMFFNGTDIVYSPTNLANSLRNGTSLADLPICVGEYVHLPDLIRNDATISQRNSEVRRFPLVCGENAKETLHFASDLGWATNGVLEWTEPNLQKIWRKYVAWGLRKSMTDKNPYERFQALSALNLRWPTNGDTRSLQRGASSSAKSILSRYDDLSRSERTRKFCTEDVEAKKMMRSELAFIDTSVPFPKSHRRQCKSWVAKDVKKQSKKTKQSKKPKQPKKPKNDTVDVAAMVGDDEERVEENINVLQETLEIWMKEYGWTEEDKKEDLKSMEMENSEPMEMADF